MITVLLASYNGAAFVAELLDSLLAQTQLPDRIVIHDDCSTDETPQILRRYQGEHPGLIEVTLKTTNSGGSAANFMPMMITERDDYLMLCDQDDIWLPDKIALTYAKMLEMEAERGQDCPIMVHTDLVVVDEDLHLLAGSFKANTFANYNRTRLRDQIIQNTATGCTVMYNRALAEELTQFPANMVMHDWWLSLVAAAFGQIGHLDDQTILYRQHTANQVGVTDMRTLRYKLKRALNPSGVRADIHKTYPQAEDFRTIFADRLTDEQADFLRAYCAIPTLSKFSRIITVIYLRVWKTGLSRNLAYLLFI
ncbi:MAG: glycosyltransferase family 2 protein [Propionibacteriaceae bacterium]|jgi:glycosyltransferase involved in cell wall biosynthesis|nr:glycosyltransferase family 2 protein [Propionibacteriaceae bacterium]